MILNGLEASAFSVREVARRLHCLVDEILFAAIAWPPKASMLRSALDKLGLEECIDARGTCRLSRLGKQVDADLFQTWLGRFEIWDALWILEERELICSADADDMWERLEAGDDVRRELRVLLQQSYLRYCGHYRRH